MEPPSPVLMFRPTVAACVVQSTPLSGPPDLAPEVPTKSPNSQPGRTIVVPFLKELVEPTPLGTEADGPVLSILQHSVVVAKVQMLRTRRARQTMLSLQGPHPPPPAANNPSTSRPCSRGGVGAAGRRCGTQDVVPGSAAVTTPPSRPSGRAGSPLRPCTARVIVPRTSDCNYKPQKPPNSIFAHRIEKLTEIFVNASRDVHWRPVGHHSPKVSLAERPSQRLCKGMIPRGKLTNTQPSKLYVKAVKVAAAPQGK